jgi:hypothetical protein
MEPTPLRHLLVMDWTEVENTPPAARRPLELQRWHFRVERLAALVDRPAAELAAELKNEARLEASRRRTIIEAELAEDLAVCRALGQPAGLPWKRRMDVLAAISGQAYDTVEERVAAAAASIRVVVAG